MAKTVIKVENLSKLYRLGEVGTGTISHDLNRWLAKMRGKEDPFALVGQTNDRTQKAKGEYVWALNDVNFEVKEGEVLGIIGKNGAGKSTLLKLLSQITAPTKGEIKIKGRIAALLEVGTGMHPEMTARENIYLNGAILGMRKHEIKAKFDEIVEFSGCAMYVDTPIKRFSSGMRVRLGFAVAAFLEPEILIVDEVLAVGDAEFQKKCLGKMKEVSVSGGRTVLFVSHNMAAVKSLCTKGIVLRNGSIEHQGDIDDVIFRYLQSNTNSPNHILFDSGLVIRDVVLEELYIKAANKNINSPISEEDEIEFFVKYNILNKSAHKYHMTFHMYSEMGEAIFSFSHLRDGVELQNGENILTCKFPGRFFNTGTFFISVLIVLDRKEVIFIEKDLLSFSINSSAVQFGAWMGKSVGSLKPSFKWINNSI